MSKIIENVSRRDVLRGSAGVFVLATTLSACGSPQTPATPITPVSLDSSPLQDLNLFVSINADGAVKVMCHRAEMGQHARTGMARVIADELDADWDKVTVVQSGGDIKYGDQNTDGSTTIRRDFDRLRRIGASARAMLEQAAADSWGVPLEECKADLHKVVHGPTGKSLSYGELAEAASALDAPAYEGEAIEGGLTYSLKARDQWRYIGKAAEHVDLDDIVTGKAIYGQDVVVEGMKYAVIARSPVFHAKLKSFDATEAKQVPGVIDVIEMPMSAATPGGFTPVNGVAVIAEHTWAAKTGRDMLTVEWEESDNAAYTSSTYRDEMLAAVNTPQERVVRNRGDVDAAFEGAAHVVSADYYVPHLSHAQMEPPAAVASFTDGKVEAWTSTQNPQQARVGLAEALGLDYADVTVNNALLGGGFGRKSKPDFVTEAALLSRELGYPVKVIWMREDDIKNGYLHAVSAQHIDAALDAAGNVTAWRHRVAAPPIFSTFNPQIDIMLDGEFGLGLIDMPFNVANLRVENAKAKGMTRIGWLRSVNNIQHAFAVQSFVAELAHAAGRDPKDYLLEMIGPDRIVDLEPELQGEVKYPNYGQPIEQYPIDTARLKNVLNVAADKIGWNADLPAGRGMGVATHRSFLTYVATAVEVEVAQDGSFTIPRMHVAVDCGLAVNPDSVIQQMEGGSLYALSNMLNSEITLTDGAIDQNNYYDYEVLRMDNAPRQIDVTVIEQPTAPPGGVGEPGTPPFAPALANALFAATGKRVRSLPIRDQLRA